MASHRGHVLAAATGQRGESGGVTTMGVPRLRIGRTQRPWNELLEAAKVPSDTMIIWVFLKA